MSSPDGQTFMLKAKCEDGSELMLGFPHQEIPNIIEFAAMQLSHGRDEAGHKVESAFETSSFQLGKSDEGDTVLTLTVGEAGNVNFILTGDMEKQLFDALGRSMLRH